MYPNCTERSSVKRAQQYGSRNVSGKFSAGEKTLFLTFQVATLQSFPERVHISVRDKFCIRTMLLIKDSKNDTTRSQSNSNKSFHGLLRAVVGWCFVFQSIDKFGSRQFEAALEAAYVGAIAKQQ